MADAARVRKVADRIHETVARLLQGRIKDPRLGFITITDVRVTGDLQQATIFYTVYGSDEEREDTAAALRSATGLIRSEVGRALGIRLTPSIAFQLDSLPTQAQAFEDALAQARARDEQIARTYAGATYAGDADPYRHDDEDDYDAGDEDAADYESADSGDATDYDAVDHDDYEPAGTGADAEDDA
ncbi:ribosome-binding factor A [Actinomyces ruminicola]|uniref:Ribosome-binding factor A n=1 Tax=Actinomyces ruminicola TaxID=332524 RepID=A0A1G9ZBD5_9ACTO|nr:30S ribosome-binding factor RbfA [Actinomyces ruminicola]SDN18445.1 ribosome-binding factor A [Actinomyces ruminicola]